MADKGLLMLIQQLKKHFPARFPEWVNAGVLATWGMYINLHPQMFTQEPTRTMLAGLVRVQWVDYPPAAVWGLVALFVGLIRACALFVNGAYSRTPLVRLITSAMSAFVWAQVVIGLWVTGIPNLGLVVYSWLVVIDIASGYRAGIDFALAEKQRKLARSHDGGNESYRHRRFGRLRGASS